MKLIIKKIGITLMTFGLMLGSFGFAGQAEAGLSTTLNGKGYSSPESLGTAISGGAALTSAVFYGSKDSLVGYSLTNGGIFNAVDIVNNELLYTELLDDVNQAWGHTVTEDGVVYMAALGPGNEGVLYRYNPTVGKVEKLGMPLAGHQFWSITNDGKDNIYIGTFKEGEGSVVAYNIASNKFENLGPADSVNKAGYVRSIGYKDGYLYLGTGVQGRLIRMDLATKETKDITDNVYDIIDKPLNKEDIKFAYDLDIVKNHVVVRFDDGGEGAIVLYNTVTQKWEDFKMGKQHNGESNDNGAFGWNQLVDDDGLTYVTYQGSLHELDTNTLTYKKVGGTFLGHRGGATYDFGNGKEFVSFTRAGALVRFNLVEDTKKTTDNLLKGAPLKLHNLAKDHDGDLYVTSYPGGPSGAKYSMKDETYTSYSQGQAEGIVAGRPGEMYFGIYPGAIIQRMDTETGKLETLFNLKDGHEQDRPYIMKYEDDLLLIGTIPDYKKLGGTLTIYNPETGDVQTHRNVVDGQSIVGLAKKGNYIFGSTTTKGGLDIIPTATKPVIFVWDVENQVKVKEIELDLPGLGETPMISGLTFDDKGQLWGAVDGFLFTMDPETYEITKSKNIYPYIQNRGMWRPVHIEVGEEGFIYTDLGGKLTVVDPSTRNWDHTTIATSKEVDFMTLSYDKDGNQNIYIVQADPISIDKVSITDVDDSDIETKVFAKVLRPILNDDFEDNDENLLRNTDSINGWSSLFEEVSANVSFGISDENAFKGTHSLKLTDGSETETVFAISDPIAIEGGKTYTAEAMLYLKDGQNTMLFRYFDANGKQIGADKDNTNIIHIRGNYNTWQKVSATYDAPEGAVTARIAFGSSVYFKTTGAYWDSVTLYSLEEVVLIKTLRLERLLAKVELLDSTLYTEQSFAVLMNSVNEASALLEAVDVLHDSYETGISLIDFESRLSQTDVDNLVDKMEVAILGLEISTETPGEDIEDIETPNDIEDSKNDDSLPATGISSYLYYSIVLITTGFVFLKYSKTRKLNN